MLRCFNLVLEWLLVSGGAYQLYPDGIPFVSISFSSGFWFQVRPAGSFTIRASIPNDSVRDEFWGSRRYQKYVTNWFKARVIRVPILL